MVLCMGTIAITIMGMSSKIISDYMDASHTTTIILLPAGWLYQHASERPCTSAICSPTSGS